MKNEMDQTSIDILLAAYFAGEADGAERAQVETWKLESQENEDYFNASKKTWDASAQLLTDRKFNTDAEWRKLKSRINAAPEKKTGRKNTFYWMTAAGVALLITVLTLVLNRETTGDVWQVAVESGTNTKNDTLPDKSVVILNRNTTIEYASAFDGEVRAVKLQGEAFFDVTRNEEQPFVIHTALMDIQVLGTSFNVRSYPEGDSVHVSVISGKVRCVSNGDTVFVTPGQYAAYIKGDGKIRTGIEDDPNRSAYRNRIFKFNDTPLGVAVQQLNDAYGCNIVLKNESLKTRSFTVTKVFNNEPVENIIEAIKVIYPDISSTNEQNVIILDCTSCK